MANNLKSIYYNGSRTSWDHVYIDDGNEWKNSVIICGLDAINLTFNGNPLSFDVPPQIINDRTMVPLRAIFEALGASVNYDESTRTITSSKDGRTIKLTIDSNVMTVNENSVPLDATPCIVDGRTLVPVRAIAEAYGADIGWDDGSKTVSINTNGSADYADISANVAQIKDFINRGMYVEAMTECDNLKKNCVLSYADISIVDDLYADAQNRYNEYLNSLYIDISANVAQIKDFINRGMYVEAMTECDNAKALHISDADINIVNELHSDAQNRYNEYLAQARQANVDNLKQFTGAVANERF